jgi:hypothetical protein
VPRPTMIATVALRLDFEAVSRLIELRKRNPSVSVEVRPMLIADNGVMISADSWDAFAEVATKLADLVTAPIESQTRLADANAERAAAPAASAAQD